MNKNMYIDIEYENIIKDTEILKERTNKLKEWEVRLWTI